MSLCLFVKKTLCQKSVPVPVNVPVEKCLFVSLSKKTLCQKSVPVNINVSKIWKNHLKIWQYVFYVVNLQIVS